MGELQQGRPKAGRHVSRRGERAPVAIVIGTDPAVCHCSVTNLPYGVDELAVAGGLRGAALDVVKCETNDLLVPATAEIVIEGWVKADDLIEEGPFGEYTGYMGPKAMAYKVDVQCLTHRHKPIYQAFLSQMPPSESSCIRMVGREATLLHHLKKTLGLPVVDVHLPELGRRCRVRGHFNPQGPGRTGASGRSRYARARSDAW